MSARSLASLLIGLLIGLLALASVTVGLSLAPGTPVAAAVSSSPPPTARVAGPPVDTIGVVSMNAYRKLTLRQAAADAIELTRRRDVDLIGWQEATRFTRVYAGLEERGWSTALFRRGASELAISWRRSTFTLASSSAVLMHQGSRTARSRFPARWVSQVDLVHDATGRVATLLNTHVNQQIESWKSGKPGRWTDTPNARRAQRHLGRMAPLWGRADGRWVLGTGDLNFDYRADRAVRTPRGPWSRFRGKAVSSYRALGARGVPATHPESGRVIDYVFAGAASHRSGRVVFRQQRVLSGYRSDHRPVLVRVALR